MNRCSVFWCTSFELSPSYIICRGNWNAENGGSLFFRNKNVMFWSVKWRGKGRVWSPTIKKRRKRGAKWDENRPLLEQKRRKGDYIFSELNTTRTNESFHFSVLGSLCFALSLVTSAFEWVRTRPTPVLNPKLKRFDKKMCITFGIGIKFRLCSAIKRQLLMAKCCLWTFQASLLTAGVLLAVFVFT